MTLMEYTVTPTAETLKRTRKTIKINTKNTLIFTRRQSDP
jgi:hypothetical protein